MLLLGRRLSTKPCRSLKLPTSTWRSSPRPLPSRAFSLSHPIDSLSQGLLDFSASLSALPLPEFLPPTAAGIIATTILVRTSITLPFFVWARQRVARHRDLVIPEIIAWRKPFAKELAEKAKKEPNSREYFDREFKTAAIAKRSELLAKYRCRPIWTTLVPVATHIPIFIFTSYVIRNACTVPGSAMNLEKFLSDTVLAQPEAFGIFPFAVGAISLASFQLSRRLAKQRKNEAQWAGQSAQQQEDKAQHQQTPTTLNQQGARVKAKSGVLTEVPLPRSQLQAKPAPGPQKDTVMEKLASNADPDPLAARVTKVAEKFALFAPPFFIVIAMTTPGALTLYWATSGLYSIGQSFATYWWNQRDGSSAKQKASA